MIGISVYYSKESQEMEEGSLLHVAQMPVLRSISPNSGSLNWKRFDSEALF
jgi:hypothetical protein